MLGEWVKNRFVPAADALRTLTEVVSVVGPFEYPRFCEELGGGLYCARFDDPNSEVDLCIIWFQDYPDVVCTRVCLVDEGELANRADVEESQRLMIQYTHLNNPGGVNVN